MKSQHLLLPLLPVLLVFFSPSSTLSLFAAQYSFVYLSFCLTFWLQCLFSVERKHRHTFWLFSEWKRNPDNVMMFDRTNWSIKRQIDDWWMDNETVVGWHSCSFAIRNTCQAKVNGGGTTTNSLRTINQIRDLNHHGPAEHVQVEEANSGNAAKGKANQSFKAATCQ